MFMFLAAFGATACIFFFQAEDGIRDLYVTGVQTCALPIFTPTSATSTACAASASSVGGQSALVIRCLGMSKGPRDRSGDGVFRSARTTVAVVMPSATWV